MAKMLETAKIPTVVISALPDVPMSMGVNRVVPGVAITNLLGDPATTLEGERRIRRAILRTALAALARPVTEPTLFTVDRTAGAAPTRSPRPE
jgi:glycine reductase